MDTARSSVKILLPGLFHRIGKAFFCVFDEQGQDLRKVGIFSVNSDDCVFFDRKFDREVENVVGSSGNEDFAFHRKGTGETCGYQVDR